MAFPLVLNARSAPIEVVGSDHLYADVLDVSATIATHWSILMPKSRSAAVEVIGPEHLYRDVLDVNVVYSHNFAGIGPGLTIYVPSFPQLDRDATDWPTSL